MLLVNVSTNKKKPLWVNPEQVIAVYLSTRNETCIETTSVDVEGNTITSDMSISAVVSALMGLEVE